MERCSSMLGKERSPRSSPHRMYTIPGPRRRSMLSKRWDRCTDEECYRAVGEEKGVVAVVREEVRVVSVVPVVPRVQRTGGKKGKLGRVRCEVEGLEVEGLGVMRVARVVRVVERVAVVRVVERAAVVMAAVVLAAVGTAATEGVKGC